MPTLDPIFSLIRSQPILLCEPGLLKSPAVPPLTHQPWIEIPTGLRLYLALIVPAVLWFEELRDPYAPWKIRRMYRRVTRELREAGLLKDENPKRS